MDIKDIAQYDKAVLVNAVKLAQRKQLVSDKGGWKEWLQAKDPENKFSDPKRHNNERLAEFLASLNSQLPDPKNPDCELIKPQKLLKRALPWLQECLKEERQLAKETPTAAAAAVNPVQAAIWSLIQRTRAHPRFKPKYDFPSYEKGWLRTERFALPCSSQSLVLLAVDCEMCVTDSSDKELLQVALVDQDGKQIIKELVRPAGTVLNYRTELTGITAAHLEGVTTDRKAVAKRIMKLLTPGTVLVGHSLHYDLESLQLDHQPVIDTAMLFSYEGLANATPALTHLADQLLGQKLRVNRDGQHDSVEDASASLALVKMELERIRTDEGPTPPLQPPELKVAKDDQCKLCIHKLPKGVTAAAVQAALAAACRKADAAAAAAAAVEAATVDQSEGAGAKQQVLLGFPHPGLANDAFSALPGAVFTDSMGRHSKRLQLQGSQQQVVVRKMACHNGLAYGKDKAKDRGAKSLKRSTKNGKKKDGKKKSGKRQPPLSVQLGKVAKKPKKEKQAEAKGKAAAAAAAAAKGAQ